MLKMSIFSSIVLLATSAFADEIVLAPGSSIKLTPSVPAVVVCENSQAVATNKCKLVSQAGTYYVKNQDDTVIYSTAYYDKAVENLKTLKTEGICD
ncbi:hypothetical protein K2X05_11285 [bacterium]|nr:hypothetical protein [bacterium]